MNRRFFLGQIARTAAALGTIVTATPSTDHLRRPVGVVGQQINYKVKGFTCVTCALGLERLLGQADGVVAVSASYLLASVTVRFDREAISAARIVVLIEECGFTVVSCETINDPDARLDEAQQGRAFDEEASARRVQDVGDAGHL